MTTIVELSIHLLNDGSRTADLRLRAEHSGIDAPLASGVPLAFDVVSLRACHDPVDYGRLLSAQLFAATPLREAWSRALASAAHDPLQVRLHIQAEDDELHGLRWETLCDPQGEPLALSGDRGLVRTLDVADIRHASLKPRQALGALVVIASPSNLSEFGYEERDILDVGSWAALIGAALGDMPTSTLGLHGDADRRATLPFLSACLEQAPPVVILVAHRTLNGQEPAILLERADGTAHPVPGDELVAAFKRMHGRPRLVVLASCGSAGDDDGAVNSLGPRLLRIGVPAVLGFRGDVSFSVVQAILSPMLDRLQRDGQIDRALAGARRALAHRDDWWQPTLWLSTDGRLWREERLPHQPVCSVERPRSPILSFFDCRRELTEITSYLQTVDGQVRTVIITGMGGLGKTELARAVAQCLHDRFPTQLALRLHTNEQAPEATIKQVLAEAITFLDSNSEKIGSLAKLQERYQQLLGDQPALVLVDNLADADLLEWLRPLNGAVIATSRQSLITVASKTFPLSRLDDQEAAKLLRHLLAQYRWHPSDLDARIDTLARLCSGMPLALELAARYMAKLRRKLADYIRSLEKDRLLALQDLDRASKYPDDAQASVTATFNISYNALSQAQQAALRCLAVFPGSFDLAAASAVGDCPDQVIDLLAEYSLLSPIMTKGDARAEADAARYELHDLLRDYAQARGASFPDEHRTARIRHLQHYYVLSQAIEDLDSSDPDAADQLFLAERSNLEAAWAWLLEHPGTYERPWEEMAADFAYRLLNQYWRLIRPAELVRQYHPLLAVVPAEQTAKGAAIANLLGVSYAAMGQREHALKSYELALQQIEQVGNPYWLALVQGNIAALYARMRQPARAIAMATQALKQLQAEGTELDPRDLPTQHLTLSNAAFLAGDYTGAVEHGEMAAGLFAEGALPVDVATAHTAIAEAERALGHLDAALAHLDLAAEQFPHMPAHNKLDYCRLRADLLLDRGDCAAASEELALLWRELATTLDEFVRDYGRGLEVEFLEQTVVRIERDCGPR